MKSVFIIKNDMLDTVFRNILIWHYEKIKKKYFNKLWDLLNYEVLLKYMRVVFKWFLYFDKYFQKIIKLFKNVWHPRLGSLLCFDMWFVKRLLNSCYKYKKTGTLYYMLLS